MIGHSSEHSSERLQASLALLPVDEGQVDYLFNRLLSATPSELPVLRGFLDVHRSTLTPRLWTVLESAKPGDVSLLPSAGALATYAPHDARWQAMGGKVAQALVSVNPIFLGSWLDVLHPVRSKLTPALAAIFRDKSRPESEHTMATNILADYASDDPDLIAHLLLDADPKAYVAFFPIAHRHEAKTLPLFRAEIARKLTFPWNDPSLDLSWTMPDATVIGQIESAQGMLTERFAFCQTMPLDEFVRVTEVLRPSGYRPTRFRPYADAKIVRVAAVWCRDGHPWRLAHDQPADGISRTDERNRKEQYRPVEVAGYLAADGNGSKPTSRFAALWEQRAGPHDARIVVGSSVAELTRLGDQLKNAGLAPRTLHAWRQADGTMGYSGVWHTTATGTSDTASFRDRLSEADLPGVVSQQPGSLIDLDLTAAPPPTGRKERAASTLQAAEAALKADPNDLDARLARASAHLQLGESQKVIDDLDAVIKKGPHQAQAYRLRAIAHARLGRKDPARADLEKFEIGDGGEGQRLSLAVIVAAELGQGIEQALQALEAALRKQPRDSGLHYDAACAYARASQILAGMDRAKSRDLSGRAICLLRTAIEIGYADYQHMQEDTRLDPIRDLPEFAEILEPAHLDRSYAAVWTGEVHFEVNPVFGLDPTTHLPHCRGLASQGYRMVSLSVARTSADGPLMTASVWHRPVITEEIKDRLARTQVSAAAALVRMDKAAEVWPLLHHSADPRLRSLIITGLNPLGADQKVVAAELERIDPGAKDLPVRGQGKTDAILYHPETSQRRALILALGTFGTDGLSPSERGPVISRLIDLYRDDPDPGIHGAVDWSLRSWGQQERLKEVDGQLSKLRDRGDRRWYVNSQGQTFAVIEGPVEFRMGSPPTEPERDSDEIPHRRIIPRRFALATREVTVEQYQEFVKENPGDDRARNDRHSPAPGGPMNGVNWYHAAAYCNWLSRKENLAECYEPNERGRYAEGMKIRADALQRTGYRLPTEAEWEYGCRAGAGTGRYYGSAVDLLGRYAWYAGTSQDRTWPCGSLLPNDLGLFDMLGNIYELCQDRYLPYGTGGTPINDQDSYALEYIYDSARRLLRGGSFNNQSAGVRSACRGWNLPSIRNLNVGFRLARTYP